MLFCFMSRTHPITSVHTNDTCTHEYAFTKNIFCVSYNCSGPTSPPIEITQTGLSFRKRVQYFPLEKSRLSLSLLQAIRSPVTMLILDLQFTDAKNYNRSGEIQDYGYITLKQHVVAASSLYKPTILHTLTPTVSCI